MPEPTVPRSSPRATPTGPRTVSPFSSRRRDPRPDVVPAAERDHAIEVVTHLLHRECPQWSWTSHRAAAHRDEARDIVSALCREGWAPARSAA